METQRSGWSIKDVICESAYWDKDGEELTYCAPREFEKLYSETKIEVRYKDDIDLLEVATLPALVQKLEHEYEDCSFSLRSVQNEGGGATVSIVVNAKGNQEFRDFQEKIQSHAQDMQRVTRLWLTEQKAREKAEHQLEFAQSNRSCRH